MQQTFRTPTAALAAGALALLLVTACDRAPTPRFPSDADIHSALAADFARDGDHAAARALVRTLGGEQGTLDYRVRDVVMRVGVMEAHYDVGLKLAQPGAQSLQQLYAGMVPEAERSKLPAQDLASYEQWLQAQATAAEQTEPAQAAALRKNLEALGACYRDAKAGDRVALMDGLVAQLLPARSGWHAEKLPAPGLTLRCLPS